MCGAVALAEAGTVCVDKLILNLFGVIEYIL